MTVIGIRSLVFCLVTGINAASCDRGETFYFFHERGGDCGREDMNKMFWPILLVAHGRRPSIVGETKY